MFKDEVKGIKKKFSSVLYWYLFDNKSKTKWPHWVNVPKLPWQKKHIYQATFINHSTVFITLDNLHIITDPIFSKHCGPVHITGLAPKRVHDPMHTSQDLPSIDIVLISHSHYDHCDKKSLQEISKKCSPVFVVPKNLKKKLVSWKIAESQILEINRFESVYVKNVKISGETAIHWSQRTPFDRNHSHWLSYVVEFEHKRIFFAGDTGWGNHFAALGTKYKTFDLALLPIGAYLPRWFMKEQHISPEEAVKASKLLHAKKAMAIHFGTFNLANDGHKEPVEDLQIILQTKEKDLQESFFIPDIEKGNVVVKF